MSIETVLKISPADMRKVLKHLPEPTYAEVCLSGGFDYSSISQQAEELFPGIKLKNTGGLIFRLDNPSREKILKIYEKSHRLEGIRTHGAKSIKLHEIGWSILEDKSEIRVTPSGVLVEYPPHCCPPTYISKMLEELATTEVNFRIKVERLIG